jgi:hypothetical protein
MELQGQHWIFKGIYYASKTKYQNKLWLLKITITESNWKISSEILQSQNLQWTDRSGLSGSGSGYPTIYLIGFGSGPDLKKNYLTGSGSDPGPKILGPDGLYSTSIFTKREHKPGSKRLVKQSTKPNESFRQLLRDRDHSNTKCKFRYAYVEKRKRRRRRKKEESSRRAT